jgi:hypothetical protein
METLQQPLNQPSDLAPEFAPPEVGPVCMNCVFWMQSSEGGDMGRCAVLTDTRPNDDRVYLKHDTNRVGSQVFTGRRFGCVHFQEVS